MSLMNDSGDDDSAHNGRRSRNTEQLSEYTIRLKARTAACQVCYSFPFSPSHSVSCISLQCRVIKHPNLPINSSF